MQHPTTKRDDDFVTAIASALGKGVRQPEILWYVSPSIADQIDLRVLSALTSDPRYEIDAQRITGGGLLVIAHSVKGDRDDLLHRLALLGVSYDIPIASLI